MLVCVCVLFSGGLLARAVAGGEGKAAGSTMRCRMGEADKEHETDDRVGGVSM